jgi:hypothetical protein
MMDETVEIQHKYLQNPKGFISLCEVDETGGLL